MNYTPNLGLNVPTPFDPTVANVWGTILNTDFSLIDSAVAGLLSLSVAGSSNVVLTYAQGASCQARNWVFAFTGALTGNIDVLYPSGVTQVFLASNATSGAYTLSVGVNNGSGSPAGSTVSVPQGSIVLCYSDGTNIIAAVNNSPAFTGTVSCEFLTASGNGGGGGVLTATGFGVQSTLDFNGSVQTTSGHGMEMICVFGGVVLNNGATSWAAISDERQKTDLVPITQAIDKLAALRTVVGRYKTDAMDKRRAFLIAQDVQKVLPEAVTASKKDGMLQLSYTDTLPLIIAAINELAELVRQGT